MNRENLILPGREVLENTIYYILKRQNYGPILSDDLYDLVVDILEPTREQLSFMKTIPLNSDGLTSVIPVLKYRFLRELQILAEYDQIRLWLLPHSNLSYTIFVPGYGRRIIDAALEDDE